MPPAPDAGTVARAFRLAAPTAPLVPVRYGSSETWRLDTERGCYLVKRLVADGWRELLTRAMELERHAATAGLPVAVPVEPAEAAFGLAADLGDGHGVVRVHEWLDAVPDGAATPEWWGSTLAALHALAPAAEPIDAAWHLWYGVHPAETWDRWLAAGTARDLAWAAPLRRHRRLIGALTGRIAAAYRSVGDHVRTHRDLVPHNVLVTRGRGPVLIDWDTAGPDSATLETAAACWDAARHAAGGDDPDPAWIAAALDSYRAHGGRLRTSQFPLARRIGLHLARCAEKLAVSLGEQPPGSLNPGAAEQRVAAQLAALPDFAASVQRWSTHMT
jgi:Ser/Thr protein kinase RdoA (MazF antagonist)